jgi:hypothetical protein
VLILQFRLKRSREKTSRVISGWCFIICNKIAIDDIYAMLVALEKLKP